MIAGKNFACRRPYSRANGFHHHPLLPAPFLRDKEYCTDNEAYINVCIHCHHLFEVSNNYGMKSNPRFLICFNVETLLVHVMTMKTTSQAHMWKPSQGPGPRTPSANRGLRMPAESSPDTGPRWPGLSHWHTIYIQQQASFFSFPSNKILGFHIKQCIEHIMPNLLSSSFALRYSCREMMLAWCKVMAHYTHGYHSAWVVLHM